MEFGVRWLRHLESALPDTPHALFEGRAISVGGVTARPVVHQAVEAVHALRAVVRDQFDLFLLSRLPAHGGRGQDVEVLAEGGGAVKLQRAIDLEEMVV
jgi:hypothetical protein